MNLQYFHNIPFFSNLSDATLEKIILLFEQTILKKGDVLIKEGDEAKGMYVIIAGEVEVTMNEKHVATLSGHDFFGELALITSEPRTAKVAVSSDDFQAFHLTREVFEGAKNELSADVKKEILRRIQENFENNQKVI